MKLQKSIKIISLMFMYNIFVTVSNLTLSCNKGRETLNTPSKASIGEWIFKVWAGNSQNLRRRVIATQMFCTCGFHFSRCNRHPLVCQLSTEKISAIIRDQPQPTGFHQMCILSVLSRHLASILLPSFLLKARANFDLDCLREYSHSINSALQWWLGSWSSLLRIDSVLN